MRKLLTALASAALVVTLAAPTWTNTRPQSVGNQSQLARDCGWGYQNWGSRHRDHCDRNHWQPDFRDWDRHHRDHDRNHDDDRDS